MNDLFTLTAEVNTEIMKFNISKEYPGYNVLVEQSHTIIEKAAINLLNSVESLPHNEACLASTRRKREFKLYQPRGLLPGLGRALAFISGTLTSDASNYINMNSHNINLIKNSEQNIVAVLNNTAITSNLNSNKILDLKIRLANISTMLANDLSKSKRVELGISMIQELILSAQSYKDMIDQFIRELNDASNGILSVNSLRGSFWSFIKKSLDPQTANYKNLKYIIKQSTKVDVVACHTHVWSVLKVPLLSQKMRKSYKIVPYPVLHKDHFEILQSPPTMVTFDDERSYEYELEEMNKCIDLKKMLICSKPREIKLLKDSCIFSLYKNTTNKCKVIPSPAPEDKYVFEDGYLTYSLKINSTQLLNLVCPNNKAQTTEIKNIGTILLPHKCQIFVDNFVFESSDPTTLKIFNDTPSFFLPKINIVIPHAYNYSFQMNTDNTKNQFKIDQEKLKIS